MKFHYYAETDSLYIDLLGIESVDSREVSNGVVLDFDKNGALVGIDIDKASEHVDLENLSLEALPLGNMSIKRDKAG